MGLDPGVLAVLSFATAVACGLVGGVFFAFSAFVMAALARLPAPQGIAAMQSINVAVINPVFMAAFLGPAVSCLALAALALARWTPASTWIIAGSLLYLAGTVLVTMLCNVPRNDALAAVAPESADGARVWEGYLASWTAWNHVRTVAALAAAAALTYAYHRLA